MKKIKIKFSLSELKAFDTIIKTGSIKQNGTPLSVLATTDIMVCIMLRIMKMLIIKKKEYIMNFSLVECWGLNTFLASSENLDTYEQTLAYKIIGVIDQQIKSNESLHIG